MDENLLRDIAAEYLVPLFSGARLESNSVSSTRRDSLVGSNDPCTIHLKAERADQYRLVIKRSQPFSKVKSNVLAEKHVVEGFVSVLNEIKDGLSKSYKSDLLATFQRRIVAKSVANSAQMQTTLLSALDQMAIWASRLYEGQPIAAAFGFKADQTADACLLHEICQTDFSAVLSNGFDSLLVFNAIGQLLGHESLSQPSPIPTFTPYRQGPVAEWAADGRIVIALNRLGEIFVFRDQKLLFVRRSGKWHFLTHGPVIDQMGRSGNPAVKTAVYETCLDASFARTGACIGVISRTNISSWKEIAPDPADHLKTETSVKAKALRKMVNGRLFQDIDRRLRQELAAIDGATILDRVGNVLAVGAILHIQGGSTGGGRLAAAKALSAKGLGIKVSQDGGIRVFVDGHDDPKFSVM